MLTLAPPPAEHDDAVQTDDPPPSRIAPSMFTPWACDEKQTAEPVSERSSDIMPELMLELL